MTLNTYMNIIYSIAFVMFIIVAFNMFIKKTNFKALMITEISFVSLITIAVSLTTYYLNQS